MLHVLVLGAVFFPGLFLLTRRVLASIFKQWNNADLVLVSERCVSTVHALLATSSGFIVVTTCKNVMTDRHWLATAFVWFAMPYMAYDIYAMYLSHWYRFQVKGHEEYKEHSFRTVNMFLRRECLLVLHHIVLLTILLPVTLFFRNELGDFFIGCLFTAELSTPFVSLGKILIQLGLQDSILHKVNGVIVLFTFFLCRILLFPYMYWVYGQHYGIPVYRVPFHLPLSCTLGNICVLAPQVYWFYMLCRKGIRLYQRERKMRETASN
ncbi:TLC domain-containing protein 3A-like [Acipenser ruthenus]|uniref:TLC domain-containing protein 3A-like n=1 Tax=Acipenser ruthenus TaxID=7906 RepID=UPI00145B42C4|nr:TLC domain-containing protein 3A-like [Acipenser ruthenus]XP_058857472.1 TLC domain-containing protein 3A-like [Acipenser ruthenus]